MRHEYIHDFFLLLVVFRVLQVRKTVKKKLVRPSQRTFKSEKNLEIDFEKIIFLSWILISWYHVWSRPFYCSLQSVKVEICCFFKFLKTENANISASTENLTTVFVLEDFWNHTGPDLKEWTILKKTFVSHNFLDSLLDETVSPLLYK